MSGEKMFEEWFKLTFMSETYLHNGRAVMMPSMHCIAKTTWDYRQQKIDALEKHISYLARIVTICGERDGALD